MDINKLLNIGGEEKYSLTEEELQSLYVYLAMQFETMSDDEKLLWIETMKTLDPEFDNHDE